MRAIIFASILLAGCNAILGIGDVHTSAGSADAPLPTVDAPPNTVTATSVVTYVHADGTAEMANEDLSKYTIDVLVVDDSQPSGFRTIHATGTKDGTLTVSDVPEGATFALELQSPALKFPVYYFSTRHELDLGFVTVGRPDAVPTVNTSPISLTLTDMTAWGTGDELWGDSFQNGSEQQIQTNPTLTNKPVKGATQLSSATFDWKVGYIYDPAGGTPRLLDKSKGDDLSIAHTTKFNVVDSSGFVSAATRIADLFTTTDVMQTDGVQVNVTGAFTHATNDQTQRVQIDLANLRTAFGDAGHSYLETFTFYRVTAKAVPYGVPIGPGIMSVQLSSIPGYVDFLDFGGIMYGDPYPSDWPDLLQWQIIHYRLVKAPGATNTGVASYGNSANVTAAPTFQVEPYTHPPANIKIGAVGLLDGGAVPFDGMKPITMTWDPVPAASHYVVRVFHTSADVGNTIFTEVGDVQTDQTSVLLPAEMFVKGDAYTFLVVAFRDPNSYTLGHLRRTGFPTGGAGIFTGVVRVSSLCGNGTPDSGEECDGMGQTATCDSDCTMAECGDGHVNPLANEACDVGGGLNGRDCDADCTAVVCGDGFWNNVAEQCDDGNTADGDGCTHDCMLETCGNGMRQAFEQCDDGNKTSGDGCTAYCKTEPGYACVGTTPSVCTRQ